MREFKNANKKSANLPSVDYIDMVSDGAASAGDMTGMIPSAPQAGHEIDAYNELNSHRPAVRKKGGKKKF